MKESFQSLPAFLAKSTYVFILVALSIGVLGFSIYNAIVEAGHKIERYETFRVSGTAKKSVKLDTAQISLGVTLKDKTPVEVQRQANEKYNKAIEAIKKLGIEEKDVKSSGYNIEQVQNPDTRAIEGYQINLSLNVTVRNTNPESEMVSKVINAATENGFNTVNNLHFYLDNYQKVQDEIKEEAINDAKARAEREAKAAGIKIGKVLNMDGSGYNPYSYDKSYSYDIAPSAVGAEAKAAPLPNIQMQPGETEVTSSITLEYEIL